MQLRLHSRAPLGVTVLSNIFIDDYMPKANGEFVKIYLFLCRWLADGSAGKPLSHAADLLDCTESDILRAIRYWEKQGLLVSRQADGELAIELTDPLPPAPESLPDRGAAAQENDPASFGAADPPPAGLQDNIPAKAAKAPAVLPQDAADRRRLTPDRVRALKEDENVRQILFIAESYMGPLNRTATEEILYIYEELHFSVDLLDYLIEYCVSKGSSSIHYIRTVAQRWHEGGISTVEAARQETNTFHRDYFAILKAFGITGRNPVASEISIMKRWKKDYGFTQDIIAEACSRTVAATGRASFAYADQILSRWKKKGVRSFQDIEALDAVHRQIQAERNEQNSARQKNAPKNSPRDFGAFNQRNYDYNDLENRLLTDPAST